MNVETAKEIWPDPEKAEAEYRRLYKLLCQMGDEELQTAHADEIREQCEFPWYAMDWTRHGVVESEVITECEVEIMNKFTKAGLKSLHTAIYDSAVGVLTYRDRDKADPLGKPHDIASEILSEVERKTREDLDGHILLPPRIVQQLRDALTVSPYAAPEVQYSPSTVLRLVRIALREVGVLVENPPTGSGLSYKPSEPGAQCNLPPIGWRCTRDPGHDGPCAMLPTLMGT